MPGIPLLNLGTALGGLAGGYNQARSQGLQQAIQQLALQQQQGLTNQQTLAGLALQAGLLNQPGGGQTPLGAATGAVPNQTAPAPTQTGGGGAAPPSYSYTQPVPGGAQPGYAPPLGSSPYGPPGDMTSADEVQLNADAGQDQFGATNQAIKAAGFSNQTASSGGSDATPTLTPTPSPTPSATPAPAQSSDSGQQSGSGSNATGFGIQLPNGQVVDMSTMFRSMDYQKLAQGIARLAPPGTSQADIYGAVVDLAKLGEGDKVQQQQAGLLLRALTNGEFKLAATGMTTQTQKEIAAGKSQTSRDIAAGHDATRVQTTEMNNLTKTQIANQTAQIRRDALAANTTEKWAQIAQRDQEIANRLAATGQAEAARQMSLQLSALRARISTIATTATGTGGRLNKDQIAELQALNERAAGIAAKAGAQQGTGP